jgi:RNA polymerase sigma-70 factor (ECF subfamily)
VNIDYQNIHKHLILRSQKGDQSAQAALYRHYARAMFNICRRMMGDEEEARDVLQEAFIHAFSKLSTLKEVSTFSFWIKRIVTNHCINALRKKKLVTADLQQAEAIEEPKEDLDYQKYQVEQIMKAVDALPAGCRTVLNLYLFEGYDHQEISEVLGISVSASKAQYSKAKARIRAQLNEKKVQYG